MPERKKPHRRPRRRWDNSNDNNNNSNIFSIIPIKNYRKFITEGAMADSRYRSAKSTTSNEHIG
jgi:hypothetical protein